MKTHHHNISSTATCAQSTFPPSDSNCNGLTGSSIEEMNVFNESDGGVDLRRPTARVAKVQLAVASLLGVFAFLCFCVLRNTWSKLYASRFARRKGLPELPTKALFAWVPVVWKIDQSDVLEYAGLDAFVFLNVFRFAIKLLTIMGVLATLVISPVRYHFTGRYDEGDDKALNFVSGWMKKSSKDKPYLWVYVGFTYVFTYLTLTLLIRQTKYVVKVRQEYLGKQNSITDRTIRLSGIPPELRDEKKLKRHIEDLNIGKVSSITICREWKPLNKLFKQRKAVLYALEEKWAEYLGPFSFSNTKQNIPVRRVRESFRLQRSGQFRDDEDHSDEDHTDGDHTDDQEEEADVTHDTSTESLIDDDYRSIQEYSNRTASGQVHISEQPYNHVRPTLKTGFLGLFGKTEDAIDYYTNQLEVLDEEILRARQRHYPATPTAFITMDTAASAQMAAQAVLDPKVHHLITRLAPAPHDIIWDNIVLSRKERLFKLYSITVIIGIISVTLIVPVGYLATLLNPKTIREFWPWLADFLEQNEWARNTVSGLLPTYLFTLLNFAIPFLYVWLSSKQGFISHGDEELSAVSKNFFYIFVNLFLVFTTAGTASNYWGFLSDTTQIAYQLARSLNELSLFYVDLIVFQGLGMFPFKLLLIGSLLRFPFIRTGCKTPRDYRNLYKPPIFNFGLHLPQPILILIITIIYSVFSAKIVISGLLYFIIGYNVYKYQLMYSVVHPPHSTGQVWPIFFRRIIVGLLLFQLTMTGTLATYHDGYILAMTLIPLPLATIGVLLNFQKHYLPLSFFIALRAFYNAREEERCIANAEETIGDGAFTPVHERHSSTESTDVLTTPVQRIRSRTVDETREQNLTYAYPYLIQPLDGPWIALEGDDVVVANSEGTVRKKITLMEWE